MTRTPHYQHTPMAEQTRKLQRLAKLLDSSIRVPGTSWRIGLDGLVGLIPGVGDVAAGAASSYILLQAVRLGAPWVVTLRMALNIIVDSLVGLIPVVGDIFDFAFKANQRNVQLLLDYQDTPQPVKRRSLLIVLVTFAVVIGVIALAFWMLLQLLQALSGSLG